MSLPDGLAQPKCIGRELIKYNKIRANSAKAGHVATDAAHRVDIRRQPYGDRFETIGVAIIMLHIVSGSVRDGLIHCNGV